MARIRYKIFVICTNCLGTGSVGKNGRRVPCNACDGKGEVEKYITEEVADEKRAPQHAQ
jgi:DnaJ-class molecular chaperone